MATTEHTINDAIAAVLRRTRHGWERQGIVKSENTGCFAGNNKRPDILVLEQGVSPVVIENEVLPAVAVEKEARDRLGEILAHNGQRILSSIAIRTLDRLRELAGDRLQKDLEQARDIEIALFTGEDSQTCTRWPSSGWVRGTIADLSMIVQAAAVPPKVVEEAADALMTGVQQAAGQLAGIESHNPITLDRMAKALCQEDSEQTRRMATTILANAFMFLENLAHGPGELAAIRNLDELRGADQLNRQFVLQEWRNILRVNYWPIFDIARSILEVIPAPQAKVLCETLAETAARLVENSLTRSHDLTGAVFQKLIVDRKFLAAYYTTPASAALMVGLMLDKDEAPSGHSWQDADALKNLKIGDFACGTGTLLSTVYSRFGQYFELHGGDSSAIHASMMSDVLVGADVLPAAAHLTAAMLSGAHPREIYTDSHIMTVSYGAQEDDRVALGSLDLLKNEKAFDAIAAEALGAKGKTKKDVFVSVAHDSFDLVIMNPPFTRATGQESNKVGVPNPMFAAFSADLDEQKEMKKAFDVLLQGLTGSHCYTGNAGEASGFIELAHRKLKAGGKMGLITPLSLMSGEAWAPARDKIAHNYEDVILLSIAGVRLKEMSFSADTGMGEAMTIATKRGKQEGPTSDDATYVVLQDRPTMPLDGYAVADAISRARKGGEMRRITDPPFGGTRIEIGDDIVGEAIVAPMPSDDTWDICRVVDLSLAQAAWRLINANELWLPGMNTPHDAPLPLAPLSEMIAFIGPYHADVNWNGSRGSIRGPFRLVPTNSPETATDPILWAHDAERERSICFDADNRGEIRPWNNDEEQERILEKVDAIRASASHLHFNQNFRFNSQSTAMQYSPRRTIGGRAWMSIRMPDPEHEAAVALWGNTTLGLLLHWWQASKQQSGRGNIGKTALEHFTCLDPAQLSEEQLATCAQLLDDLAAVAMRPLNEIAEDPSRAELDRQFLGGILGLPDALFEKDGPLDLLRRKLAGEPSVHGGKKS